jgi:1-pyrroline-4-hydroxy-2-carboxylate deaminase
MKRKDWAGVMPAITTPFDARLGIDLEFFAEHAAWMVDAGCTGIVAPGSLGEGASLSLDERATLWRTLTTSVGKRAHVVAAIAAASTSDAVQAARLARDCGCVGLMVLPPYLYKGSWREMHAHFSAVLRATPLSCMLYNNPIAYGTDVTPAQVAELAREHANLHAVKESSGDVRRLTAIRELIGDDLALFVGLDDLIVEGIAAGAVGWIAGLVNALPHESVRLFELARDGKRTEADALYRWFLPLLRMDTTYDFVQLIKLVQDAVGQCGSGGPITRPPRLLPDGKERRAIDSVIQHCLNTRPKAKRARPAKTKRAKRA